MVKKWNKNETEMKLNRKKYKKYILILILV